MEDESCLTFGYISELESNIHSSETNLCPFPPSVCWFSKSRQVGRMPTSFLGIWQEPLWSILSMDIMLVEIMRGLMSGGHPFVKVYQIL